MVSAGMDKVLEGGYGERYPDMRWEARAAFDALAEHYRCQPNPLGPPLEQALNVSQSGLCISG